MKNNFKRILSVVLALALIIAFAACSNAGNSRGDGPKHATIGIALYQDTGPAATAVRNYLDALSDTLNVSFVYTVLTQTDESANLTKIQELIAARVDGIICTMDLGTSAILNECRDAGVYLAGYLSDYNTSYLTNYDAVFKNEYFLGTVSDGPCGDDLTAGYDYFNSLIEYNERHSDAPITHVAMTMFPAWAFPSQQVFVEQFTDAVEKYNATAATPITLDPLDEAVDVLQFAPLDSTYFAKHDGIQAIISFAAGSFVFPTIVSAGYENSVKLFASSYNEGDENNFGSNGNGVYQQETICAVESINYPLVLLLNKINGVEFSDMPADAERRSCLSIIINSDEDMQVFKKSLYGTGIASNALYTPEDVLNMTAFGNPNATYAGLVDTLNHMTIDDIG